MSSANNVVGAIAAYLSQGTAATTVSNVTSQKQNVQSQDKSFDKVLSKVTDNLVSDRSQAASREVKKALNETKASKNDTTEYTNRIAEDAKATEEVSSTQGQDDAAKVADTVQTNETQGTEANEELQEAINEDGKVIIEKITDAFELPEDAMINAMQVLGLMAADMMNPETIIPLVAQVSGSEDVTELITDSDIYTSLQDLMEGAESMRSELMNEFDLSEEELKAAIDDTKENFGAVLQQNVEEAVPEDAKNINKEAVIGKEQILDKAPQSEVFSDQPEEEPKVEIVTENANKGSNDSSKQDLHRGAESTNLFNQIVNNITEAVPETQSFSQVSYTDRAQMENIIRQITDRITIMQGPEETSLELALHPASLGNVNVLLQSGKDGITAKFTAQNELVKEAVESQMVQLQQKFEEQGIKVTSIEITIASHAFEQNLEQGNENRDPSDAQGNKGTKPLRRINLSEVEEETPVEEMSDAERIAVQMMAMNGNTVDFSA
ncbi:flagellar hook-length control protein FliK [Butyrivibrio sp. FCS014]|uniref:flagellar hook-length control protein FliK n=1 Tax=Butyrivibrio sp. FCS014 TaxID=1408304 RepID=UPI00046784C3|nr:flagellar hook-length control protein FliK [Butyrivibrio sp. FCS014]